MTYHLYTPTKLSEIPPRDYASNQANHAFYYSKHPL